VAGKTWIFNEQQKILAFKVQASAFGLPIPLAWGRNRVPGNLMWYGDFTPIAHTTETNSGGKGGGGVATVDTTYTYTAALAILLGEGQISSVLTVWVGKKKLSASGLFGMFTGSYTQSAWAHLTTNHPSEALTYRGVAYLVAEAYDLGGSASLENHNFEVNWGFQYGDGIVDAHPADILDDLATNVHYGIMYPASAIGDWTQWTKYCTANGIFLSPAVLGQRTAAEFIEHIARLSGAGIVFSEGLWKMIPYSDEAATGNGETYTPDVTPVYELTDDDYTHNEGEDPVLLDRTSPADAFNQQSLIFSNRANDYNEEPVEAKDQSAIETYGLRTADPVQASEITEKSVGRFVVQQILQRTLYTRATYQFALPWQFALLEPMDLLLINDTGLGLISERVRVIEITETDEDGYRVTVEEFPTQIGQPALYASQEPGGFTVDYNVPPGSISTPLILDAPGAATVSGYEILAAVSGNDPNWGGAIAWVSLDGDSYRQAGSISGRSRYGVLSATLPTGSDPDVVNTCAVDLTISKGALLAGVQIDADNLATLCYVDGELIAYTAATLTAQYRYSLDTYIRRGVYNTPISSHLSGTNFARLDQALLHYAYDPSLVGKTIYLKFTSFNIYGGAQQELADATEYAYVIQGPVGSPANVTGFTYTFQGLSTKLSWTRVAGDKRFLEYEIRQGASWEAGTVVGRTQSDFLVIPALTAAATFFIKASYLGGDRGSIAAASVVITPSPPNPVSPSAMFDGSDVKLTWPVPTGGNYQVARYEVRYGTTWAGGTSVGFVDVTTFRALAAWSGSRTWWVGAIDISGQMSTPASIEVVVTVPSAPTIVAEVIDNNVLLRWTDAVQTLPLKNYELRRGDVFSTATVIGTVQARFATIFESVAGFYKYWVVGVDSAGNYGTEQSITTIVSAPPDFVFYDQTESTFTGTKTNCLIVPETGKLLACVFTAEVYQDHFTTRSWDQPQDQIDAGYPIYVEPSQTTGKYEETIDYGTVIPSTMVSVSVGSTTIAGAVTITPTISVKKLVGDPWIDYAGVWQAFATDFQYVKITLDFTSSGGNDLITVDTLTIRLDVKIKNDSGIVTANAGDSGGTTVNFNVAFIDIRSITGTPQGTTPVTWVIDFTDVPDPTSFKILVFDLSGTRVTRDVRWEASGS